MSTLLVAFPQRISYIRIFARFYANLAVNTKVNVQNINPTLKASEQNEFAKSEEKSSSTISSITSGELKLILITLAFFFI